MDDFFGIWSFSRTSAIPIIDCVGEANDASIEPWLINTAIAYIEQAEGFKGIAIQGKPPEIRGKITVYFSLQFPNESKIKAFIKKVLEE